MLGQEVTKIIDQQLPAGVHTMSWDGRGQSGNRVASGIYFYRLITDNFSESKKMVLLRDFLDQKDFESAKGITHGLRGSAGLMGAKTLEKIIVRLDLAAKEKDLAQANVGFEELEEAFSQLS